MLEFAATVEEDSVEVFDSKVVVVVSGSRHGELVEQ